MLPSAAVIIVPTVPKKNTFDSKVLFVSYYSVYTDNAVALN